MFTRVRRCLYLANQQWCPAELFRIGIGTLSLLDVGRVTEKGALKLYKVMFTRKG
jgi:hypothetical protein